MRVPGRIVLAVLGGDAGRRAALNAIVHPLVHQAADEAEAAAVAAGHDVVVHDVPLLVETGQAGHFDVVVVVDAPPELRVSRLTSGRGLTPRFICP